MFNDNNGLVPEDLHQTTLAEEIPDLGVYRAMLRDEGMDDEIAAKVVVELFHIMRMCVEMGYTNDLCGQLLDSFNEMAAPESGALDSSLSSNAETPEQKRRGKP